MHAHQHPEPAGLRRGPGTVCLIVGLPGVGKTTREGAGDQGAGSAADARRMADRAVRRPEPGRPAGPRGRKADSARHASRRAGHQRRLRLRVLECRRTIGAALDRWHPWARGATSSTCRSAGKSSAGGSPTGSPRRPAEPSRSARLNLTSGTPSSRHGRPCPTGTPRPATTPGTQANSDPPDAAKPHGRNGRPHPPRLARTLRPAAEPSVTART
jgi:hypothetical protein